MSIGFKNELLLPENRARFTDYLQCKKAHEKLFTPVKPPHSLLRGAQKVWDVVEYVAYLPAFTALTPLFGLVCLFQRAVFKLPGGKSFFLRFKSIQAHLTARLIDFPIKTVTANIFTPLVRTHNGIHPFSSLSNDSIPKDFFAPPLKTYLDCLFIRKSLGIASKLFFQTTELTKQKKSLSIKKQLTGGICQGMSHLFAFLVLKAWQLHPLHEDQLLHIAKFFQNGAPDPAVILQALPGYQSFPGESSLSLLGLCKKKTILDNKKYCSRNKFLEQDLNEHFQKMPAGVYKVLTPKHALTFVKLNSGDLYLFDPNSGLHRLDRKAPGAHCKRLVREYIDNWEKQHHILCEQYPDWMEKMKESVVTFHPLELKGVSL